MTVTQGMTDKDPHADVRRDVCQFADDRLSDATKLAFVHELLQRHIGEARLYLDRIQRYATSLDDPPGSRRRWTQALAEIARDADARTRFLDFARDADRPAVRVRMIDVARDLGWLSADAALGRARADAGRTAGPQHGRRGRGRPGLRPEPEHDLDGAFNRRVAPGSPRRRRRACRGSRLPGQRRRLVRARCEGLVGPQRGGRPDRAGLPAAPPDHRRRRVARRSPTASPACRRPTRRCGRWRRWAGTTCPIRASWTGSPTCTRARRRRRSRPRSPGVLIRADLRSIAARSSCAPCASTAGSRRPGDNVIDALIDRLQASLSDRWRPDSVSRPDLACGTLAACCRRPPLRRSSFATSAALLAACVAHGVAARRALRRRPSAPSPSTRPTRRTCSSATCRATSTVRRTGAARPARLARLGLPARRDLRRAGHFRALRRRHRVLHRPLRRPRVPDRARPAARVVQRIVQRPVLAAQGGLPLRLQHAEVGADGTSRPPRSLRSLVRVGPFAGRRRARGRPVERALRPEQPRPAASHLQGRAGALRLFVEGAARPHGGAAARALLPDGAGGRGRERPREPDAARSSSGRVR